METTVAATTTPQMTEYRRQNVARAYVLGNNEGKRQYESVPIATLQQVPCTGKIEMAPRSRPKPGNKVRVPSMQRQKLCPKER
ncbi:hypothetical protein Tco_0011694 [Tanacetum coccineum]